MELQIQKAIELSLASAKREGGGGGAESPTQISSNNGSSSDNSPQLATDADRELEMAIELSQKEIESNKKRQMEEEEMLEKALALSMNEK